MVGSAGLLALITVNIWEDFFITFRCSANLADGNGLDYEVGRGVHGVISPLDVLTPAGLWAAIGSSDPLRGSWAYRIVALVTLAGAWVLLAPRINNAQAAYDGRGIVDVGRQIGCIFTKRNRKSVADSIRPIASACSGRPQKGSIRTKIEVVRRLTGRVPLLFDAFVSIWQRQRKGLPVS